MMEKLTPSVIAALVIGLAIGFLGRGLIVPSTTPDSDEIQEEVEAESSPQASAGSNEAKIQEAKSAAPSSVSSKATIMDFPATGSAELVELQKGSNDWTCLPDYPASPGKDPMCLDKQGMVWMEAYMMQQAPNLNQAGLAYMLAGGSDASNTDPFATGPAEGNDWVTTGPHTMVFPAGTLDQTVYSTDPKNGGPWIMWAGTPFEHLMIPVE